MGKIDVTVRLLAGLVSLAFCGPGCRPRTEPALASHGGVSMTLTLDVDFGRIAPSETTERVIQLPNSFSSSVKPMNVVSSCKCLDALVEKRSYAPGEGISVRVLVQASSHIFYHKSASRDFNGRCSGNKVCSSSPRQSTRCFRCASKQLAA